MRRTRSTLKQDECPTTPEGPIFTASVALPVVLAARPAFIHLRSLPLMSCLPLNTCKITRWWRYISIYVLNLSLPFFFFPSQESVHAVWREPSVWERAADRERIPTSLGALALWGPSVASVMTMMALRTSHAQQHTSNAYTLYKTVLTKWGELSSFASDGRVPSAGYRLHCIHLRSSAIFVHIRTLMIIRSKQMC